MIRAAWSAERRAEDRRLVIALMTILGLVLVVLGSVAVIALH
jgi:hypothetical protein